MYDRQSAGLIPIAVGDGRSTPKPEELDKALDKGANVIDLHAAALSKAVDKNKLN